MENISEEVYKEYKKYKTQWLVDHGYTLDDVIDYLQENYKHQKEDPYHLFEDFEEFGFDYDIYACFDEWYNNEYQENI